MTAARVSAPATASPRAASKLRLAFYGDDFTGSTDALEVLAFAGLRCALFLEPPSAEVLARFGSFDAIGVAGDSRAMSPQEMERHLPAVLDALATSGAPIVHYKVCSTFDSAPGIGSIGRVLELAKQSYRAPFVPIVAGTPALGRWCLFGHLHARSATDSRVYRIDRHPIMSVHPVTPMGESDLTRHIGAQASRGSTLRIDNLPYTAFDAGREALDAQVNALAKDRPDAVVLDSAVPAHLTEVGRLLERMAADQVVTGQGPLFVVGSSGAEYALTQWWRDQHDPVVGTPDYEHFDGVDRVLAISGSASKLSARQVDAAMLAGFVDVPIDAQALIDETRGPQAARALVAAAVMALEHGRSVILHTARGPDDPRIEALLDALVRQGMTRDQARHEGGRKLGVRLGEVTREVLRAVARKAPLRRVLLSGGDTSSQIVKRLGPDAMVVAAKLARGVPLCRLVGGEPGIDGLEIALKGGQLGGEDFFEQARRGQ